VAWVLTAYLLSASVLTPIVGRLGDMFGKEHTLVAALACLGIGTLIAALATSIGVMIVGRIIQGCGGRSSRWRSGSSATSFRAQEWRAGSR
jgi:MFS family permease